MAASWPPGSVSGQVRAQRDDDCSQANHPQNEDIYLHPFSLCRWGGVPCAGGLGCTLCLCQAAGVYLVPARRALSPSMLHDPCAHPCASPCARRKHRSQREMPKRVRHPLCRRTLGSGPLNLVPVPFPLGYHSPMSKHTMWHKERIHNFQKSEQFPLFHRCPLFPVCFLAPLAAPWLPPGCCLAAAPPRESRDQPGRPGSSHGGQQPGSSQGAAAQTRNS